MKRPSSISRRVLLIGACLLAVVLTAPLTVGARQETRPQPQSGYQRDYGSWSYSAGRAVHGRLDAHVWYDTSSIAGLRAYAAANRALADQLARAGGRAEVQVTFRVPMALDTFRIWATSVGLTVQAVDIRTLDTQGMRSTLGVFPRGGDPLPQTVIDRQLGSASQKVGPLTVTGVTNARGTVEAARLPAIAADAQVFLADVTATVVRRELGVAGEADAAQTVVTVQPPFWHMEALGLGNFR